MASILEPTPTFVPPPEPVALRLAGLRAQVRSWFLVEGVGRVLWTLLALAAVSFVLDYTFRLDSAQRAFLLFLGACIAVIAFSRRLIKPLTTPIADDALILEVERRNPQLAESLISAVQFHRLQGRLGPNISRAMVDATIERGLRDAVEIPFHRVLDERKHVQNIGLLLGAGATIALVVASLIAAPHVRIWFQRNVLLQSVSWPQNTYLTVERLDGGVLRIPRGDDYTLRVLVTDDSRITPERVLVDFHDGRNALAMKRSGEKEFEAVLANVIQPFSFHVRGGDARTESIRVELVEPPRADELTLEVTYPRYAGGKTETLPAGKGPYYVLSGGSLKLRAVANKPLQAADLVVEGERFPMTLTDERNIAGELSPEQIKTGLYALELRDVDGLTSRNPTTFGLRVRPDREPRVRARIIGIGGMVSTKARLPIAYRVTDDYGVTETFVAYRWSGDAEGNKEGNGKLPLLGAKDQMSTLEYSREEIVDLEPLAIPTATGLTFSVSATDNDDYVPGPNIGKSPDFTIRVVTDDELRADILRREKEQRQEFERLVKQQEELLTFARELEAQLGGNADLAKEQTERLAQSPKSQKLIAVNSGSIQQRLALILVEIGNNRLEEENGPLTMRLRTKIVDPLAALQEGGLTDSLKGWESARRSSGAAKERRPTFQELVAVQETTLAEMKKILGEMSQAEGFQEAINLLYEVQKSQQEALDRTKKALEERRKGILEGKEPGPTEKPASDAGKQP